MGRRYRASATMNFLVEFECENCGEQNRHVCTLKGESDSVSGSLIKDEIAPQKQEEMHRMAALRLKRAVDELENKVRAGKYNPIEQSKCKHCKMYQSWTGARKFCFAFISGIVAAIGVLLAIVSMVTTKSIPYMSLVLVGVFLICLVIDMVRIVKAMGDLQELKSMNKPQNKPKITLNP